MKLLRQFGIILALYLLGEFIHNLFNLPIPGSVIGMIVLFVLLISGIIKIEMLEEITAFLLSHLPFFFIPAGVGLLGYIGIMKGNLVYIILISFVTTIFVMVMTGKTVEILRRKH